MLDVWKPPKVSWRADHTGTATVIVNDQVRQVKLRFFGATADIAGMREMTLPLADGSHADALLLEVLDRFPAFASHKLHLAVNQQYAAGDEVINAGDELAVFTAVSGG